MQSSSYYNPLDTSELIERRRSCSDDDNVFGGCLRGLVYLFLVILFIVMFSMVFSSCRTAGPGPVVVVRDSIRTEVHFETVIVHDTVAVSLPHDSIFVAALDDSSRIETNVAVSEAFLRNGLLYHSIWNKPSVNVGVDHKETVRDSIVYKEKEVPVPYPVEVKVEKELSWWQQQRIAFANIMLIVLSVFVIYKVLKNRTWLLSLIKRLI